MILVKASSPFESDKLTPAVITLLLTFKVTVATLLCSSLDELPPEELSPDDSSSLDDSSPLEALSLSEELPPSEEEEDEPLEDSVTPLSSLLRLLYFCP